MPRSSFKKVEESKMRLLSLIARSYSKKHGGACLSVRKMAGQLDLTEAQIAHARKLLIEEGLVQCRKCFAEDGGCLANVYSVTPKGRRRLDWEEASNPQALRVSEPASASATA